MIENKKQKDTKVIFTIIITFLKEETKNQESEKIMSVARITSVSRNVTQDHLMEIFSHFGTVLNVILPKDSVLDIPKGYAYVEFENTDDASKAVESMNKGQIDGLAVNVNICDKNRLSHYITDIVSVKENGVAVEMHKAGNYFLVV